jgi:peptidoglycan/xylan/chitin deacetylase (PgdA/CDA1 family)
MSKGIFTISLDFELYWGVRDHRTLQDYGENIRSVHQVVPRLLALFNKYNVHCTWAAVGLLFCHNKNELMQYLPDEQPAYLKKEYDPYTYILKNELDPVYHFAPALIEQIKNTPGQEIGTHTFSHFYTLEKNTTLSQFRKDLQAAKKIASQHGIGLNSIIFPRNQYTDEHIKTCRETGIKIFRGNELAGAYKPVSRENENNFRRVIRFADSYFNLTGHHCYAVPLPDKIINVPASRFLRPYNPKLKWLNGLKLLRIKSGLNYASANGLIYHLWWHPHNFGNYIDENFRFLEVILQYYSRLNKEGKMESLNLFEIYSHIMKHAEN